MEGYASGRFGSQAEVKRFFEAYYMCRQHGCASNGKSVARAKMEYALKTLVHSLTPAREMVGLASAMFRDLWDRRAKATKERRTARKTVGRDDPSPTNVSRERL